MCSSDLGNTHIIASGPWIRPTIMCSAWLTKVQKDRPALNIATWVQNLDNTDCFLSCHANYVDGILEITQLDHMQDISLEQLKAYFARGRNFAR